MDMCGDEVGIDDEKKPTPPPPSAKPRVPPVSDAMYSVLGAEDGGNTPPTIPRRTADSHIMVDSIKEDPSLGGGVDEGVYELPAAVGVGECVMDFFPANLYIKMGLYWTDH